MPPREDGLTLFVNAQVFDGSGQPLFPGEVLVRGDRIAAVAEGSGRLNRDEASVINCAGATLMPGLVEAHAHLSWPSSVGRIFDSFTLPPEEHMLVTARNARVTLDAGFSKYPPAKPGALMCEPLKAAERVANAARTN